VLDDTNVVISGPGVKRRRCNIAHLEPTDKKLDVSKGASDDEVKSKLSAQQA